MEGIRATRFAFSRTKRSRSQSLALVAMILFSGPDPELPCGSATLCKDLDRTTHPESPCPSLQVYQTLEELQVAVAGPFLEPETASHSPPSPQENSYMSTSRSALNHASPRQPLVAPLGAQAQATDWPQKGANQPVESDESVSDLSAALHSWHLSPSCPAGPGAPSWAPAPLGQAAHTQGGAARESSWGSGPGLQPTAVEGTSRGTKGLLSGQTLPTPAFWAERPRTHREAPSVLRKLQAAILGWAAHLTQEGPQKDHPGPSHLAVPCPQLVEDRPGARQAQSTTGLQALPIDRQSAQDLCPLGGQGGS